MYYVPFSQVMGNAAVLMIECIPPRAVFRYVEVLDDFRSARPPLVSPSVATKVT